MKQGDAERAVALIRKAELELGKKLSNAELADLLADNFPSWSTDYIKHVLADAAPQLATRTIEFNTGRKYTAEGQIIRATLHPDRVVTFFDH